MDVDISRIDAALKALAVVRRQENDAQKTSEVQQDLQSGFEGCGFYGKLGFPPFWQPRPESDETWASTGS